MKKKTLTLLLIVAVAVLATSCGYSLSEKRQMKAYQKQAEKNAVSYINEKYGLDAEDVYIPVKSLRVKDSSKVVIGMQYDSEGERCYKILNPNLSDDGVYIHTKIYTRDCTDICFAPFVDAHE